MTITKCFSSFRHCHSTFWIFAISEPLNNELESLVWTQRVYPTLIFPTLHLVGPQRELAALHPQPAVLVLEKRSSWGKHLISIYICLQSFFFLLFFSFFFLALCFSSLLFAFHIHTFSSLTYLFSFSCLILLLPSYLVPGISFTPLIHTSSSHILSLLQIRQLNW